MIEIKNFTKRYGGLTVYDNFNLNLEEGKITCLLGASGSGKTTLLNALAGLIPYDGGELPKLKCSYVFQSPTLVPNLTVRGNLKLVCKVDKKIDGMLERVGLQSKANAYPISLSGGEAQRAALARAFLFDSDVLLLDEPFSSLDIKLKLRMLELFFEVWKGDGRTVLMVTHDVDEAEYAAQRVIVISGGKIDLDFTPPSPVPRQFCRGGELREKLVRLMLNES